MTNKRIAGEFAVGTILILSVLIGGIFWMQNKRDEYGQKLIENDQVAVKNVKEKKKTEKTKEIYKNEKFNFQLEYPIQFQTDAIDYTDASQAGNNLVSFENVKEGDLLFGVKIFYADNEEEGYDLGYNVNVEKTNFNDIESWFANWKKNFEVPSEYEGLTIEPKVDAVEDIVVSGVPAKKYKPGTFPFSDTCVSFIKEGLVYNICYDGQISEEEREFSISNIDEEGVIEVDKNKEEEARNKYRQKMSEMVGSFKFIK